MQERLNDRIIDLTTLKEHQIKYEEFRKKHRKELSRKRGELSRFANNEFLHPKPEKSKYYTIVREEAKKYKEDL